MSDKLPPAQTESIVCTGCRQACSFYYSSARGPSGEWFCSPRCRVVFENGVAFSREEERTRRTRSLETIVATCLQVHCAAMITAGLLIANVNPPDVPIRAVSLTQDLVELVDLHGNAELLAKIENLEATIADLRDRLEHAERVR